MALLLLGFGATTSRAQEPDTTPPTLDLVIPETERAVRELVYVEVFFSERVQRVDASDLRFNGVAATNVLEVAPGEFLFQMDPPGPGTVQVEWAADHGITDLSGLPFDGIGWTYEIDPSLPLPEVVITEFMADNRRTLRDEDGDSTDWIELFNTGTGPVELGGWFLTDTRTNLTKWAFPATSLSGRTYRVVFASNKDRTNAAAQLHTNFKLSAEGGYLALVDARTNIVSEYAPKYPRQTTDVSFGRVAGEMGMWGYFTKPTPGAANSTSGPGFAPAVEFSRPGGTVTQSFWLELSVPLSAAIIRYTRDGSFPTNHSAVYSEPLFISNSVQIRARAYADSLLPGPPAGEHYLFLSTNLLSFTSDLPVLVLHSLGKGAPSSSRLAFAALQCYEPVDGRTSLTNPPTTRVRAGVQIRGSSTEGLAKSSYKLEVRNELDADLDESLLGLPAESDWVLYAPNTFEPVLIHNPFVHQLSRDMGRYSPRTRFIEVYFNKGTGPITASHYMGIYVLEEKIKIGPDRLAIDKLDPEDLVAPAVTGGYLLKIDRLDPGDSGLSAGGVTLGLLDPKEPELESAQRRPQQTYLRDCFNAFQKALTGTNWLNPTLGYAAYIDVDGWIDFHVLEVLSGNVDALVLSTYFHKIRSGPIQFGPHWDFDRALGSTDGRDANPRVWTTGPFFSPTWWNRLFADKDFWQRWVDRWQELRQTHFSLAHLHGLIDRLASDVRQAQPREYQKWRIALRGGSYQSEINLMKNWLSNRIDFIDKQLTQPPTFSQNGGPIQPGFLLTLTGPTGASVYYTLDGTDPRARQGTIATGARLYAGPVRLDANARVVARARDTSKRQVGGPPSGSYTPWSRPVAATFVVGTPPLRVTEVMFHPTSPEAGSPWAADDHEFIELKNSGALVLGLTGFRITNGVDFVFASTGAVTQLAPGERTVVVANQAAFAARYPGCANIAGEFTGRLANDGNRLTLVGPLQEPISDFRYGDRWQPLADGAGFSLVVRDETTPPDTLGDPICWRASAQPGGSPGQPDPAPRPISRVHIHEVDSQGSTAAGDMVEVVNSGSQRVDLSGWFLSDDLESPRKYRFPDETQLGPWEILAVTSRQFGGSGATGFGLDADGEEIYLFSADRAGVLTGYCDGMEFGRILPGRAMEIYRGRAGQRVAVEVAFPTPGAPNAAVVPPPVILTEVRFHPASNSGSSTNAFIELFSQAREPTPLYDPDHPANTWRLRGAMEFDFPPGLVLEPGGCLLVVGFDPVKEAAALASFRARHAVTASVPVVGPWQGTLDASHAPVVLTRPLAPESDGQGGFTVPRAQVDTLPDPDFAGALMAKAVDGAASVARTSGMQPGAMAEAWFLAKPSPGATDADGDGLPDEWERLSGLDPYCASGLHGPEGDPDADGFSNRTEFLNHSPPWGGPVEMTVSWSPHQPDRLLITWLSLSNRKSRVFQRDVVPGAPWYPILVFPADPTPKSHRVDLLISREGALYRVLSE